MAEGVMKKKIIERGLDGITVSSMGTHAQEGNSATDHAVEVCREHGIDISQHCSRPLIPSVLKECLLILAMEQIHVDFLDLFFPQVSDRVYMLAAWPDRKSKKATIADPVGRPISAYRKTFKNLENTIDTVLPGILTFPR
jgi:protein-tyrosine phosphatase